jgi:hypothetical protein
VQSPPVVRAQIARKPAQFRRTSLAGRFGRDDTRDRSAKVSPEVFHN